MGRDTRLGAGSALAPARDEGGLAEPAAGIGHGTGTGT
jgi:hypothetical protein